MRSKLIGMGRDKPWSPALTALVLFAVGLGLQGCGKSVAEKALEAQNSQAKAQAAETAKAAAQNKALEEAEKNRLTGVLRDQLKDPASLQLRNVKVNLRVQPSEPGKLAIGICGEYNAKNSFGGYGGFAKFAVVEFPGGAPIVFSTSDQLMRFAAAEMVSKVGC
jgi:hypothetical protein